MSAMPGATRWSCSPGGSGPARALFESAGLTNREGLPDGPSMLYYERAI